MNAPLVFYIWDLCLYGQLQQDKRFTVNAAQTLIKTEFGSLIINRTMTNTGPVPRYKTRIKSTAMSMSISTILVLQYSNILSNGPTLTVRKTLRAAMSSSGVQLAFMTGT